MAERGTTPIKVSIDNDLVERLEELARKYGRRSGNQVAAEILELYNDLWEAAEENRHAFIHEQKASLLKPPSPATRKKNERVM